MADVDLRYRQRVCKNCAHSFTYFVKRGRDPEHCGAACREAYKRSRRLPKELWPTCLANGCGRRVRSETASLCNSCYTAKRKNEAGRCSVAKCRQPATRIGAGLCETHYYRVRRNGRTGLAPRVEMQTSGGYTMRKAPSHPLASASNGWAYEHRLNAYDKYGDGPHPCHWCGVALEWKDIVVDHLNEVKGDNSSGNLVVACSPCNRARGAMIGFIRRMQPNRIAELVATFDHMRSGYQCTAAE